MSQQILNIVYLVGDRLIYIYMLLIVVTAFLSWIPPLYHSRFGEILRQFTEPADNLIRRFIPPIFGLDFSPIIVLLLCELLRRLWSMVFSSILIGI